MNNEHGALTFGAQYIKYITFNIIIIIDDFYLYTAK